MYSIIKRALDIFLSIILLIALSPIFLILAIYTKIRYKKIIFSQKRTGKNNTEFIIYKFVTMNKDEKSESKILRKIGLDELPQLLNILKGEMSFVGPRPWLTEFSNYFNNNQMKRLNVKPGLTGYSQIINDEDILRRIDRDLYYVEHYNLLWDISIIIKTLFFVLLYKKENLSTIEDDIKILKSQKKIITNNYSVILPVCNKDNSMWLKKTIESVLNQTYKTNDFIIITDGKINNSLLKTIKKYKKIRLIENEKIGLSRALNKGIKESKNSWIARIDADDYWSKDKIEKQLLYIENHKDTVLIGTNMQEFFGKNNLKKTNMPIFPEQIIKYSKYRNPFRHSSVIFKKEVVVKLGMYDDIKYFEDYDLWFKIIKDYKTYNLEEPLTFFRVDNNLYKRRGGIEYLKHMISFERKQLKQKNINISSFIIIIIIHGSVCLMSNRIRKITYERLLRR